MINQILNGEILECLSEEELDYICGGDFDYHRDYDYSWRCEKCGSRDLKIGGNDTLNVFLFCNTCGNMFEKRYR